MAGSIRIQTILLYYRLVLNTIRQIYRLKILQSFEDCYNSRSNSTAYAKSSEKLFNDIVPS